MLGSIIGSAAAPIVGSLVGSQLSKGDYNTSMGLQEQALASLQNIALPEEKALKLEEYVSAGLITPEMAQAYTQSDTELANITTDPRLREAQMQALTSLQDISDAGGMTLTDRANMSKVLSDVATQQKGAREGQMQALRARGMSGSGMDLAAALNSSQAGAQTANQNALNIEAQAQARALESLMSAGTLGGNIREQDYSEQAKAAEAQDLINKFNVANRQDVSNTNVSTRNSAQAQNLANKQALLNSNVDTRNTATTYNQEASQRAFDNALKKAGYTTNQTNQLSNAYANKANRTQQMWSGIGQGVGQGVGTYGQYSNEG